MGSDGRRLWWQLSTDRGNAAESNTRCQEELALVQTFSTFPGINNVNPILLGFNLINQNEALAHKSLAHCHRRASQLKLWGALLLMHYSQTVQLLAGLFLLSGGSWRPSPNVHRRWWDDGCVKSLHKKRVLCTCECVWMQSVQVFGFLLSPPPRCVDLVVGRVGSDDVTQQDSVGVLWRTKLWIIPEPLNPGQTFAAKATITDQCLKSSPSLFRFYCPQLSPFIVPPMFSFPDVPDSCFTAGKKKKWQSTQYQCNLPGTKWQAN